MEPFTLIVYHTAISKEGIDVIGNIYPEDERVNWKARWEHFQKDYLPQAHLYIETLFLSARLLHPECQCVVLTDESTKLSLPETIEIKRYPIDPEKPAYNRLLAQKAYLKESDDSSHHLFLDYDMLLQQSLEQITAFDFDVALTFDAKIHRVNGSFILVKRGSREMGIHYLEMVEKIFLDSYTHYTAWGGISVAMYDLFMMNFEKIPFLKTAPIDKVKIFTLPSEKYNHPVTDNEIQFHEYLPDKMILHFKGLRKKYLFKYWNSFLRPNP